MDPLTPSQRSERMSRVRSAGNKSTEEAAAKRLVDTGILGWERHPSGILGHPDFFFRDAGLVIFVDGCFWHACPACRRRSPITHGDFWLRKIDENRRRDNRQRRRLRSQGFHVIRVWEHEIPHARWLRRVRVMLARCRVPLGAPKGSEPSG